MQYLGAILKMTELSCFFFQGKPFSITVIQVYSPTAYAEKLKLTGSMKTYKTS